MKQIIKKQRFQRVYRGLGRPISSNVKSRSQYERFGETIRYLTVSDLQRLFDYIEDYRIRKTVIRTRRSG